MSRSSKAPPLPREWIERLFSRFQAMYGNRMATMWGKADPLEVQSVWADRLGDFSGDDVREAIDGMGGTYKDFPPTVFQFVDLCRDAKRKRSESAVKIDYTKPPADREVTEAMHETRGGLTEKVTDPRAWARRIIKQHEAGIHVPMISLAHAREALGL